MTFEDVVQFHGHKCPGLAMGFRMAVEAMDALASVRAEDEELVAIVENDACGVDALQCITGCTFGKGNLLFRDHGKQVYTIYVRRSRSGVRVVFHGRGIPNEFRQDRSALADWILAAPAEEILSVTPVAIQEPEPARIMESKPCAFCGESVMVTKMVAVNGKPACRPCHQRLASQPPDRV